MADFKIERNLLRQGFRAIAGVDEVGRGALFGPVVAAAVSFAPEWYSPRRPRWLRDIDDSKLLAPTNRVRAAGRIIREAESLGIGVASSREVDEKNIFWASHLAMARAIEAMAQTPDFLLVDGFPLKDVEYVQMGVCQGDRKSLSIAAASIVAKVFRDDLMAFFDGVYAGYGLARNKGYGTEEHYRGLREKGPTALHRMSFKLK